MNKYIILLTSAGGGLSAELRRRILNINRYDIEIIAVDAVNSLRAKIFSHKFELVPNGGQKNYSDKMAQIVRKYNVNLVIPCSDEEALNLARNRKKIEVGNCKLACVNFNTLSILSSKINTYKFLEKYDIFAPIFAEANSIKELKTVVSEMLKNFEEIVVKPSSGRGGRNVTMVNKKGSGLLVSEDVFLTSTIDQYNNFFPIIVMEKLYEPIYDIDILAINGNLIRSLVRRRLNPKVPNEGHIIEKFDELYSIANKLVQVLKLSWLYDCDFMLNNAGQPKLLEINPRPSGSLAVSLAAGVNFIEDIIAIEKKDSIKDITIPYGKVIYPFASLF